jgi:hypothetical protein
MAATRRVVPRLVPPLPHPAPPALLALHRITPAGAAGAGLAAVLAHAAIAATLVAPGREAGQPA